MGGEGAGAARSPRANSRLSTSRPAAEKEFTLPLPKLDAQPGVDYRLNVSFTLKAPTLWAPKGHEIAWDQFELPVTAPARRIRLRPSPRYSM